MIGQNEKENKIRDSKNPTWLELNLCLKKTSAQVPSKLYSLTILI